MIGQGKSKASIVQGLDVPDQHVAAHELANGTGGWLNTSEGAGADSSSRMRWLASRVMLHPEGTSGDTAASQPPEG
jgi:hypothetical protein